MVPTAASRPCEDGSLRPREAWLRRTISATVVRFRPAAFSPRRSFLPAGVDQPKVVTDCRHCTFSLFSPLARTEQAPVDLLRDFWTATRPTSLPLNAHSGASPGRTAAVARPVAWAVGSKRHVGILRHVKLVAMCRFDFWPAEKERGRWSGVACEQRTCSACSASR